MNPILHAIIGLAVGAIKWMIATAMENNARKHHMYLQLTKIKIKDVRHARKFQNKEANWARRFIVVNFTLALVAAPVIYAFMVPDAMITIPILNHERSFWSMLLFWVDPIEVVKYHSVPAMVIVLQLLDLYALILGYYFGSGGSRGR